MILVTCSSQQKRCFQHGTLVYLISGLLFAILREKVGGPGMSEWEWEASAAVTLLWVVVLAVFDAGRTALDCQAERRPLPLI